MKKKNNTSIIIDSHTLITNLFFDQLIYRQLSHKKILMRTVTVKEQEVQSKEDQ